MSDMYFHSEFILFLFIIYENTTIFVLKALKIETGDWRIERLGQVLCTNNIVIMLFSITIVVSMIYFILGNLYSRASQEFFMQFWEGVLRPF